MSLYHGVCDTSPLLQAWLDTPSTRRRGAYHMIVISPKMALRACHRDGLTVAIGLIQSLHRRLLSHFEGPPRVLHYPES